jgi:hypothetical protein
MFDESEEIGAQRRLLAEGPPGFDQPLLSRVAGSDLGSPVAVVAEDLMAILPPGMEYPWTLASSKRSWVIPSSTTWSTRASRTLIAGPTDERSGARRFRAGDRKELEVVPRESLAK